MNNTSPQLEDLWACFQGMVPAALSTCAIDGTPNITFISQVYYVDARHVAISFQFFNKTRHNVLAQPEVEILVVHPLTAGRRTTQDWLGPVAHPSNGGGFWSSTRYSGFLQLNVQPWSDGGVGHAGYIQRDDFTPKPSDDVRLLKVWQDGVLVKTSDWASATLSDLPDGPMKLRMDLTVTRDKKVWTFSPKTHTVWNVRSPGLSKGLDSVDILPVLQVGYDVKTDLAGYTRGGKQSLRFSVSHLADAYGPGKVRSASLSVSYDDGKHWTPVPATRAGSWWSASFTAPSRGYVSLRVRGRDSAGNTVTQDIVRAYGLRGR